MFWIPRRSTQFPQFPTRFQHLRRFPHFKDRCITNDVILKDTQSYAVTHFETFPTYFVDGCIYKEALTNQINPKGCHKLNYPFEKNMKTITEWFIIINNQVQCHKTLTRSCCAIIKHYPLCYYYVIHYVILSWINIMRDVIATYFLVRKTHHIFCSYVACIFNS